MQQFEMPRQFLAGRGPLAGCAAIADGDFAVRSELCKLTIQRHRSIRLLHQALLRFRVAVDAQCHYRYIGIRSLGGQRQIKFFGLSSWWVNFNGGPAFDTSAACCTLLSSP